MTNNYEKVITIRLSQETYDALLDRAVQQTLMLKRPIAVAHLCRFAIERFVNETGTPGVIKLDENYYGEAK